MWCTISTVQWWDFKKFKNMFLIISQIIFELHRSWITGSGWSSFLKNLKTPFFPRYQKILSSGNSNGSKTSPKFFSIFFSTNMDAGGVQSFCILEGATDPLIEQWLEFSSQFSPDMWWTNAENFKSISWAVSDLWSFNWKNLASACLRT